MPFLDNVTVIDTPVCFLRGDMGAPSLADSFPTLTPFLRSCFSNISLS